MIRLLPADLIPYLLTVPLQHFLAFVSICVLKEHTANREVN